MFQALKFTENVLDSIDRKGRGLDDDDDFEDEFEDIGGGGQAENELVGVENLGENKSEFHPKPGEERGEISQSLSSSNIDQLGSSNHEVELKRQIGRLIEEKMNINSDFQKSLEEKERDFHQIIKKLQNKDEIILRLQEEKEKLNQSYNSIRKLKLEEMESMKSKLLMVQQEHSLCSEEIANINLRNEQGKEELRKGKEDMERSYIQLVEKMNEKDEELKSIQKMHVLRRDELKMKEKEVDDYKDKVRRILEQKNDSIKRLEEELKKIREGGSDGSTNNNSENGKTTVLLEEYEQEKKRNELEIESMNNEIRQLNKRISSQKKFFESDLSSQELKVRHLEKKVSRKEEEIQHYQESVTTLKENFNEQQTHSEKRKKKLDVEVKEKDKEIHQLQFELEKEKTGNTNIQKLKKLSELMIRKQGQIETLESEKVALKLQVEKAENKVLELLEEKSMSSDHHFHGGSDSPYRPSEQRSRRAGMRRRGADDTVIQIPMSPKSKKSKGSILKKIRRKIDLYSISFQKFLSKNQKRRVSFLIYVFVIHFLLLVVIYTR